MDEAKRFMRGMGARMIVLTPVDGDARI